MNISYTKHLSYVTHFRTTYIYYIYLTTVIGNNISSVQQLNYFSLLAPYNVIITSKRSMFFFYFYLWFIYFYIYTYIHLTSTLWYASRCWKNFDWQFPWAFECIKFQNNCYEIIIIVAVFQRSRVSFSLDSDPIIISSFYKLRMTQLIGQRYEPAITFEHWSSGFYRESYYVF